MNVLKVYLDNVTSEVHRNLRWLQKHPDHYDKEAFLSKVIAYCEKLLNDPEEPRIKRRRVYNGRKFKTVRR